VRLEPEAQIDLPVAAGQTAVAYLFEGEALFGPSGNGTGEFVQAVRMVVLGAGDRIHVRTGAGAPARFMLMAGTPIGEPIVPYGPFVMNTPQEIQQALSDLRNGTFVQS
jgi:redox-sensitive bicupin YhaK (pirin superfamily)